MYTLKLTLIPATHYYNPSHTLYSYYSCHLPGPPY